MNYFKTICLILGFVVSAFGLSMAGYMSGTVRVGQTFVDDEGDRSVNQSSYNIYEGTALSIENLQYCSDNMVRVTGNFRNISLNNRNLSLSISKSGFAGLSLRNSQYRRVYSSAGDAYTRRNRTSGDIWVQVHEFVRLTGGYGVTNKKGQRLELFEPETAIGREEMDYTLTRYDVGASVYYQSHQLNVSYRGSKFEDEKDPIFDRTTGRFQITGSAPLPRLAAVTVNAGFQNYQTTIKNRPDTLKANTAWGGLRYFGPHQISLRTSFVFDRARRTGDLTASDNLLYAVYVGKNWQKHAGVVVGYQHRINDDVRDEITATGYSVSLWGRPYPKLLLRADYGSDAKEVKTGRTLTGDQNYTRFSGSARYDLGMSSYARIKFSSRNTENKEIGSEADFDQVALELSLNRPEYGTAQLAYSLLEGQYVNSSGGFYFKDHVLTADLLSRSYRKIQVGFGATYMRGKEDIDIESSQLRFSGLYSFLKDHEFSIVYRVFNYDDFKDDSPIYSKYYTSNVVEVSVAKKF